MKQKFTAAQLQPLLAQAKETYITGTVTLRELIRRTGIPQRKLSAASRAENWPKLRSEYRLSHGLPPYLPAGRAPMKTIDWEALCHRYVTGALSLRDLSKETGIDYATIAHRSAADAWTERRRAYRAELAARIAEDCDAPPNPAVPFDLANLEDFGKTIRVKHHEVDYDALRVDYITGCESRARLAARYNIPLRTLASHITRSGWKAQRDAYRKHRYTNMLETSLSTAVKNARALQSYTADAIAHGRDTLAHIRQLGKEGAILDTVDVFRSTTETMHRLSQLNLSSSGQLSPEDLARYTIASKRLDLYAQRNDLDARRVDLESQRLTLAKESAEPQTIRFELSPELDELAR